MVLILIVVEERIGYDKQHHNDNTIYLCLNPYCSGRKNRILNEAIERVPNKTVLILIVVEERIG